MNKKFYLASALSLILFLTNAMRANAQSFHHNIQPQFSGGKPPGEPTSVPTSSNKRYGLLYPKTGATYQIGLYVPVDPSPSTASTYNYANYYLLDNNGKVRLVHTDGGRRCGNDLYRVNMPSNEIYGIEIRAIASNGEALPPGEYSLVISKGNNGYYQTEKISGEIIARSGKFKLVTSDKNYNPARFSGTISLPAFDARLKLPANAREEFFDKAMTIYLTPEDRRNSQVKIQANKSGYFEAIVPPGTYTLMGHVGGSGSDRHTFFFGKHLSMMPTDESKITFNAGDRYEINYNLRDDDAGANFRDGFLDYTIQPGQLKKTP